MIKFDAKNHKYTSVDTTSPVNWISVTSMVSLFKPPFDPVSMSIKATNNPRSKWYGMDPKVVQSIWKGESKRSTDAGTWYHDKREKELLSSTTLNVYPQSIIDEHYKLAPSQKLTNDTIYPEFMAYSLTDALCGQSDKVEIVNKQVNITDYKTIKVLKTEGFVNWEGVSQKMTTPIDHLDDCHLVHYTLQLSFYLYIILKHNPQFRPGTLTIEHVRFKLEAMDDNGFPVYSTDVNGEFIVEDVKFYNVPYLKTEILAMLSYYKDNQQECLLKLKSKS